MGMPKTELRPAWRNYWAGFVLVFILLLAALGGGATEGAEGEAEGGVMVMLALLVLAFILLKRFSWKFVIDDQRVSRHYGLISRNQQSVKIRDLRSVEMDQGIVQRILGTGTLSFYSAGSGNAEIRFPGIKKPMEWRDKIDSALDNLNEASS